MMGCKNPFDPNGSTGKRVVFRCGIFHFISCKLESVLSKAQPKV